VSTTPQCPEALYSPDIDVLRRCIQRGPHEWHMSEDGVEWRPPLQTQEDAG
jgi:hypothetical protein